MADQPRNVRDADEDAKPQPGATETEQDTPAVQTEPDAKPQPGAKPASNAPAESAPDTAESKPTEEPASSESKPTEEPESAQSDADTPDEPAADEKPELEDPRIADLKAKLAVANAQAAAVTALADAGLPVSLAGLVRAGNPDDIQANVEALAQAIADAVAQKSTPAQPSLPPDAEEPEEDMRARARRIFA